MAVELAVVLPVVLAVMVIVVDCMVWMGECARFDQVASQKVLACATSPAKESYAPETRVQLVSEALAAAFAERGQTVSVSCEDVQVPFASMATYRCTLQMVPWPLSHPGATVFGISVPVSLEHECVLVIDPYTPGKL